MPVKKRIAKGRDIDDFKLDELIEGPGTCLLAGGGYYLPHSGPGAVAGEAGGFFWELSPRGQEIVLERMRADWERLYPTVLAMADAEPWAARQFGNPAQRDGGVRGSE